MPPSLFPRLSFTQPPRMKSAGRGGEEIVMKNPKVVLLVLALLLPVATGSAQAVSFIPALNLTTGNAPVGLATGDFNGDGNPDLVVANANGSTIFVLLGDGNGSFTVSSFAKPGQPFSVAVGDFNEDGILDLSMTNARAHVDTISIMYGLGDGTFGGPADLHVLSPLAISNADFNADGNLDLIVTDGFDKVYVFLGDGTGSFELASTSTVGDGPRSIVTGDLNRDGKLDMAVANENSGNISVLLGDGAGSFGDAAQIATGAAPETLAIGDLDLDGDLDLAVANEDEWTVSILLGDGAGSFGAPAQLPVRSAVGVVISDLNGDGKPDLAATNVQLNTVSVLLGDGTGAFGAATSFGVGESPRLLIAGDFNGDGKPDLACANESGAGVSVLINTSAAGNTPAGANVNVQPADSTTGTTPVSLTFSQVTQVGETSLSTSDSGPAPPSGFQLGSPATYYELTTTALFSGAVEVCVNYSGVSFQDESQLRLFHFEGGAWADRTSSVDTTNKIVCGNVSSLSPFAIFERAAIPVSVDIKPGGHPNTIKLGSGGSVTVAVLGRADFDAARIDPATVTLAGAPVRLKGRGVPMASLEDVNGDGRFDLVVHCATDALRLSVSDVSAVLLGRTFDGALIRGADSVRVVP
jgi:hypothetical protein